MAALLAGWSKELAQNPDAVSFNTYLSLTRLLLPWELLSMAQKKAIYVGSQTIDIAKKSNPFPMNDVVSSNKVNRQSYVPLQGLRLTSQCVALIDYLHCHLIPYI